MRLLRKNSWLVPLKRIINKKYNSLTGFTLIEIIAVIVILAIVLTPFSILVVNVMQQNAYSQSLATAVGLAESQVERVGALRFSSVANEGPTPFSAPFSGYNYQVVVDYVDATALNTPVAGPTDYKRVQIKVNSGVSGIITLTTLVTREVYILSLKRISEK